MDKDLFLIIYRFAKKYIQKSHLSHSLHPHEYHHWNNAAEMINSGLIGLLIDKINLKYNIKFEQMEANLICKKANFTQFTRIFNLKKELFNQLLTESNSNRELVLNAIKSGNLEIVKKLIPESIDLDTILEFMKEAFILGYIDILEHLHQIYQNNNYYPPLDIFKWLNIFRSRSISGYYWVSLWLSDNSTYHKRIKDIFNVDAAIDNNDQRYLKKAIIKLGKPYWYNFLALGDPSLYFSCKEDFKVVENQGADWGSNYFNKQHLLNPSFSDRLRLKLMLTVYIYERYHKVEKTIESALLEIVNGIRKRHPHCQIDDHATGFEEHVFLLLVLSTGLKPCFPCLKPKLISAEFKVYSTITLETFKKVNTFLISSYGFSETEVYTQLITEYPALFSRLSSSSTNSLDVIFNSLDKIRYIFSSLINGEVFNDHTEEVLLNLINSLAYFDESFVLLLECKTPQSLRFIMRQYEILQALDIRIEISDDSLYHLLRPMFDNILEDYPHSVLFNLLLTKAISCTDKKIDLRVTSIVSALEIEESMKIQSDYNTDISIKQFLHFSKLLDYYKGATNSNIDFHLVGSIASIEIYEKLKDAASNNKIILSDDWKKQVNDSAEKYIEFSPVHKKFIEMTGYDPTENSNNPSLYDPST